MAFIIVDLLNLAVGFTVCDISTHINKPPVPVMNDTDSLFYPCLKNRTNIDSRDFEAAAGK
jgi:hypothetical protein